MNSIPSFDGRTMNAVKTASNGVVNHDTIFSFSETDGVITASYIGGQVKHGYLIGKISNSKFEFQYTQIHTDNQLDGGHSICEIEMLADGRVQLIEHFKWSSGEGTNVIEELEDNSLS